MKAPRSRRNDCGVSARRDSGPICRGRNVRLRVAGGADHLPEPSEIAIRTTASAAEGSPCERYWNGVLERIHCGAVFASGRFTWLDISRWAGSVARPLRSRAAPSCYAHPRRLIRSTDWRACRAKVGRNSIRLRRRGDEQCISCHGGESGKAHRNTSETATTSSYAENSIRTLYHTQLEGGRSAVRIECRLAPASFSRRPLSRAFPPFLASELKVAFRSRAVASSCHTRVSSPASSIRSITRIRV